MPDLMIILTGALVIIGVLTIVFIIAQIKEKRREVELIERKASLPPDIKVGGRMHDHEGVYLEYTIAGRSDLPVELQYIALKAWDRNNPSKKYSPIQEKIAGELAKGDKPVKGRLLCPRHNFESDETRNSESMRGSRLFRTIAGEFCLHYLDHDGKPQDKCEPLGNIMNGRES